MNQEVNPNMIILARESRTMTQSQLAVSLGITQGKLSKVESGLLKVSKDEVEALSRILNYPKAFFFEAGERYPLGMNYYRKHKGLSKTLLTQINAIISIIRIQVLNKLLRSVDIVENKVIQCDLDEDNYETPEDVACAVRRYWNLPSGRIENVIKVLENAGIIVIPYDFPSRKFSGVSALTEQGVWVIFANQNMPADRLRFTLIHELGHIIMHRFPTENMESESDRFAAEFLMPTEDIANELRDINIEKLAYLKTYWKVAMSAILRKAYSLSKITENQYRYLNMQMAKAGYKLNEPVEFNVPYESPMLLQKIIKMHLDGLDYSLSELTDTVNLYDKEFSLIHQIKDINQLSKQDKASLTLV